MRSESSVTADLCTTLATGGAICAPLVGGVIGGGGWSGQQAGLPDRLIMHPATGVWFIEAKRENVPLSAPQQRIHSAWAARGALIVVARYWERVRRVELSCASYDGRIETVMCDWRLCLGGSRRGGLALLVAANELRRLAQLPAWDEVRLARALEECE